MEFRILGPLEVVDNGKTLPLGGARQRALVTALLLRANEPVSTDRLLDDLWSERPPETGVKALHVAISQLRKTLGVDSNGRLTTRPQGYVLRVAEGELDLHRFERLVEVGRSALENGDPRAAAAALRDALALWRGPALADVAYEPFAQPEIRRLEEMRLAATEDLVDAELALGRHAAVVGTLESLVTANPLRERLRAQLMLALYRCGRQAEALQLYQDGRRALDELGIEPSARLQQLERGILNQDPSLDAPAPERRAPRATPEARRGFGAVLVGAGLLALAIAVGVVVAERVRADAPRTFATVPANAVGVIDPATNGIVGVVRVGGRPRAITAGDGAVWVANHSSFTVSKVDPRTRTAVETVILNRHPTGVAVGGGDVWVTDDVGAVRRFESSRGLLIGTALPRAVRSASGRGIVLGEDAYGSAVWALHALPPTLVYMDPGGGGGDYAPLRARLPNAPTAGAYGERALWIASAADDVVLRIEPRVELRRDRYTLELEIDEIAVGRRPAAVAVGSGAVWVANRSDDSVTRIQPWPLRVRTTIPVGDGPRAVAVGAGAVWVANGGDATVSRIDPATNRVTDTIRIGNAPAGIAVSNGLVWVTVDRRLKPRNGGPG